MHAWGNGTCRRRLVSLVVAVVSLLTVASAQAAELLVGNVTTDQVLRYDGTTGAFLDAFVAAGSGGLDGPQGLVFGPDGALYVSSAATGQVLRYNGTTGAFLDAFVAAGSGAGWPLWSHLRARRRPLRQQRHHRPGAALPWDDRGVSRRLRGRRQRRAKSPRGPRLRARRRPLRHQPHYPTDAALPWDDRGISRRLRGRRQRRAEYPQFPDLRSPWPQWPGANLATVSETHMGS